METSMKRQPSELRQGKTLHCHSDAAFPDPGLYLNAFCGICGRTMAVDRNILGPTSSIQAMAVSMGKSSGRLRDRFYCVDREEPWHRQAFELHMEADQTSSRRLTDILLEEANETGHQGITLVSSRVAADFIDQILQGIPDS